MARLDLPSNGLLPDSLIEAIHKPGDVRSTVFIPRVTLRDFSFQELSSTGYCKEAVAHVLVERIGLDYNANSMNTGPYCNARLRLQLPPLKEAVTSSGQVLHEKASDSWLWNGYRILLVDGMTLLMPDTDNNQKTHPQQSAQKPGLGFIIVWLAGLVSLATGACVDYAIGPFQGKKTGKTSLFSNSIQSLCKQDLLLAGRYYTSYAKIALLTRQGTALVFRQQSTVKSDFSLGIHPGTKDHMIRVKKPKKKTVWISEAAWAERPNELFIRAFSVKGTVYVTTLTHLRHFHLSKPLIHRFKRFFVEKFSLKSMVFFLKVL